MRANDFRSFGPQPSVAVPGEPGQEFYECEICGGAFHPAAWDGDCRDDANRFHGLDELDELFPDWIEVDMPT